MGSLSFIVVMISAVSAVWYGFSWINRPPTQLRAIWKTLPVTLLAVAVLTSMNFESPGVFLLVLALILGAAGDFSLAHIGPQWFLRGLSAFLLAHICYAVFFLGLDQQLASISMVAALVVCMTAVAALLQLWKHLGDMRIPVLVYVIAIVFMAFSAILTGTWFPLIAGTGLFLASDLILAQREFVFKGEGRAAQIASYLVWWTYYPGQLLIALSWIS